MEKEIILRLRSQIPEFECISGCQWCCGVIFFSRWEQQRVPSKPDGAGLECVYATGSGCAIYSERPLTCRWYGAVEGSRCPKGCGPQQPLTHAQALAMIQEYHALLRREETTMA